MDPIQPTVPAPESNPPMQPALTPVKALVTGAYQKVKGLYQQLFPILALFFISSFIFSVSHVSHLSSFPGLTFIVNLAALAIYFISYIAIIRIIAGREMTDDLSGTLTRSSKLIWQYIWVVILVGLVTLGSFATLIIPGIIIAIFLSQASFTVILEDTQGLKALYRSWHYIKGRWWATLGRVLVMALVVIIISIILNIIFSLITFTTHGQTSLISQLLNDLAQSFIIVPFAAAYTYLLYSSLKDTKLGPVLEGEEQTARTWTMVFLVIGIALIVLIPIVLIASVGILYHFGMMHPGFHPGMGAY